MRQFAAFCMLVVLGSQSVLAFIPPPGSGEDEISGKSDPTSIKAEEIPDSATPVYLNLAGATGILDLFQSITFNGFGEMGNGDEMKQLMPYFAAYWMTDKEVTWKGGTYEVAYQCDMTNDVANRLGRSGRPMPDIKLHLVLVNKAAIVLVTPRPELTKAGFVKALSDAKSSGGAGDRTRALNNLKQVGLATIMYENDYDDVLPATHSASQTLTAIQPYIKNLDIFKSLNPNGGQILYNVSLAGVAGPSIPNPAVEPLFYDSMAWPDGGRPVTFLDGHASYVTADNWPAVLIELNKKYKPVPKPKPVSKPKK